MIAPEVAICVFTALEPDYDCIAIAETRMYLGKLTSQNPGDCDVAHCTAK